MAVRQKGRRYMADVMVKGVRYRASFATYEEAEQYERDVAYAVASGREVPRPKTKRTSTGGELHTLKQLYDHVYRTHWSRLPGCRGVISSAQQVVATIGPDMPVTEITKITLQEASTKFFEAGNSVATVNRKMAAASKMLSEALELGIIDKKPGIPKGKEMSIEVRYLSEAEEEQLLSAFKQLGLTDWCHFVVFAVDTGMRLGELLRLRWSHIRGDVVTVWKSKSNKPRSIPLTRRAAHAITVMQQRYPNHSGPFTAWADNRSLKGAKRHEWDAAMRNTGLERRIHDLRHTCASRLVQRGVDLLRVKEYMGHSNVQTTLRYAHLAPSSLDTCRDVLDRDNNGDKWAARVTRVAS